MKTVEREARRKINHRIYVSFFNMPRLCNLPPYECNDIVRWIAQAAGLEMAEAFRFFGRARVWSAHSDAPCLVFDHETKEWHGGLVQ